MTFHHLCTCGGMLGTRLLKAKWIRKAVFARPFLLAYKEVSGTNESTALLEIEDMHARAETELFLGKRCVYRGKEQPRDSWRQTEQNQNNLGKDNSGPWKQ